MEFRDKLKRKEYKEIWQQYCGFLDLSMDGYMQIQRRLMEEQIQLWSSSGLGQRFLQGKHPKTIDEFREMVPLTTYDDYADVLLAKRADILPGKPNIWVQTTWEGGKHPVKLAPYTRSMLDTFKNNVIACIILSTSKEKGQFNVENTDKFLYGLAPLPYITGLIPLALGEATDIEFLPPVKEAVNMSFSERNKLGFKMAMKRDLEYFFGLGSVVYAVSQSLGAMTSSGSSMSFSDILKFKPKMILRYLKAKRTCKHEKRPLMPKDLFKLKGFMITGTDNFCYKDDLEELWGIRPMEMFAGTEPSVVGTETWTREGMYFFPDTCFYEFIREDEMMRNLEDPSFVPRTYLMDEVLPGEKYELVLTVLKGGAFARYRCGDMYRCVGLEQREEGTRIPRFEYTDRVPWVIDIAGFTRISQNGIESVIQMSKLPIVNWVATKEYNESSRPFLHMYVELEQDTLPFEAMSTEILRDLLSTYFKYIDQDYRDLKKILGMDPLEITILRCGTFEMYEKVLHRGITHMSPSSHEISDLLKMQDNMQLFRDFIK